MITLIFLICLIVCINAQDALNWANETGFQLKALRDNVMKMPEIISLFYDSDYERKKLDATEFVQGMSGQLAQLFKKKEDIVRALASGVGSAWSAAKNSAETQCSYKDANEANFQLKKSPALSNQSVNFDFSAVLVAPEAKPSELEICFSEELDRVFADNDPDSKLPWQYFGSQSGYHRQYPASQRSLGYDPRIRPWYTGSSSGSKSVILVLDTSGSMRDQKRMPIMKEAALAVIDSLTVNDYVNIVSFSTSARAPRCAGDNLLPATPVNLQFLRDYIGTLNPAGQTDFYNAFEMAFDLYEQYKKDESFAGGACSSAILFLTDGKPSNTKDHHELIQRRNTDDIHIFTYALGSSATTQDDIACENDGIYAQIEDGGDLRGKMASYYQLFSLGAKADEIFWTAPYFDASGLGMMVTGALPVFDAGETSPLLLGVVGHDVVLSDFTELVDSFESGNSYAFLVDQRGNAVMHPRMNALVQSDAPPIYQDIALLENQLESAEFLREVRGKMLEGTSGSYEMDVVRLQERGDSAYEGLREQKLRVTYIWEPVGPFIFGYALTEEDLDVLTLKLQPASAVPTSYYHALNLYDQDVTKPINPVRLPRTHPKYKNQYMTFNATTFYLAPRSFIDPAEQSRRYENREDVMAIHDYINAENDDTSSNPGLRDGILAEVRRLSALDKLWAGIETIEPAMALLYLGTPNGVHRRYPGGNQNSRGYDPTLRPWYKRASTFPNTIAVSTPYFDASGLGRVVTLAQTVARQAQSTTLGGIVGLDFTYPQFAKLVRDVSPCADSPDGVECLLLDSSGYVVYHSSFDGKRDSENTENVFVATIDEALAQSLIVKGFLSPKPYDDFRSQAKCLSYTVDPSSFDGTAGELTVDNVCGSNTGRALVSPVPINNAATNIYAVVLINKWRDNSACLKAELPNCKPLEAADPCEVEKVGDPTSALPRAPEQCSNTPITELALEELRGRDISGGTCSGLSSAAVAGIVIAAIVFLCCVLLCAFIYKRRN